MKYIVWEVTAENFEEVARFANESLANTFAEMLGNKYQVTKIGETPIW